MEKKTFENTSINETTPLMLEANGYARIWSHEKVTTSNSVFCLLGQSSSVQNKGFRLNYSPSIDIGFKGYLELGVENLLNIPQEINFLDVIGKIIFFDVSSSLNVDEMIDNYWIKIMRQRQIQQWSNADDETDLFE
jgi:deoxycytidine triphosphate deaminase